MHCGISPPKADGEPLKEVHIIIGIIVESAETSGIRPKLRMVSAALSLQPPILISLN